jgi:hypothetical protein
MGKLCSGKIAVVAAHVVSGGGCPLAAPIRNFQMMSSSLFQKHAGSNFSCFSLSNIEITLNV